MKPKSRILSNNIFRRHQSAQPARKRNKASSGSNGSNSPVAATLVRVVTDSTASLPKIATTGHGPVIVPLSVYTPDGPALEGSHISAHHVGELLRKGEHFSTSQPSPEAFSVAFHVTPDVGAIVAIFLSGSLSGTYQSAVQSSKRAIVPVTVIDSRTTAMGLGFAALAAAETAATGQDAEYVADRARAVAASAKVRFLVDSLKHLKGGGRISTGTAAFGTALGVRPILEMRDGRVELAARVRAKSGAVEKLVALTIADAQAMAKPVFAVHHLDAPDRGEKLAARLRAAGADDVLISPLSAVLGAHVGPGAVATVVADWGQDGG